ncbi:MAG: glycosyltransferase family 2 protein [Bacteroidota bacterium]
MPALIVVIPVYNEEESLDALFAAWVAMLRELKIDFKIHAYNDGSKDGSLAKLRDIEARTPELIVFDKPNSGHGPTILLGYRQAEAEFVFQIDSDDEIKSEHFPALWAERASHDFIIGQRNFQYQPPLSRRVISAIARYVVAIFYGRGIHDVNCPYRLFRKAAFAELLDRIPEETFAPNLILAGYAAKKRLRIKNLAVDAYFRQSGEVSIQHMKLLKVAIQSFGETIGFSFRKQGPGPEKL